MTCTLDLSPFFNLFFAWMQTKQSPGGQDFNELQNSIVMIQLYNLFIMFKGAFMCRYKTLDTVCILLRYNTYIAMHLLRHNAFNLIFFFSKMKSHVTKLSLALHWGKLGEFEPWAWSHVYWGWLSSASHSHGMHAPLVPCY